MNSLPRSSALRSIHAVSTNKAFAFCRKFCAAAENVRVDGNKNDPVNSTPTRGSPAKREAWKRVQERSMTKSLTVHQALDLIKSHQWAKFDETVEISINLGVDPRKPNQSVKGVASLPSGTGKPVKVMVFTSDASLLEARFGKDGSDDAKNNQSDIIGGEELIAQIQAGIVNVTDVNTVIATPEMMSKLSKIGKILGPRGLMPNPKMRTVVAASEVERAVAAAKAGAIKFKVERKGIVQAGVGKLSFSRDALLANIRSLLVAIQDAKPEGLKGKYMRGAHLTSSMGPSIHVDLPSVDPSNPRFMLEELV